MKHDAHFCIEIAARFNCANAAAVLDKIAGWQKHAESNGKNLFEGRHWVYNTVKAWGEQLPWMTEKQIRRVLEKLEQNGVIKTGNFNKHKRDRTKWYCIIDEAVCEHYGLQSGGNSHLPKRANAFAQMGNSDLPKRANDICPNGQSITNNQPTTNQQLNTNTRPTSSSNAELEDSKTVGGVCLSDLPDYVHADDWSDYVASRAATQKPLTAIRAKALLKRLRELHRAKVDVNAALQAATINGWMNVYPDQTKLGGAHGSQSSQGNSGRVTDAEQLRRDGERARQRVAEHEARQRAASGASAHDAGALDGEFYTL